MPDLERDVTNIYKLSAKTNLNLLTFEKLDMDSLKNFYTILEKIKYIEQILAPFNQLKKKFKSSRLISLLTFKETAKKNVKTEPGDVKLSK